MEPESQKKATLIAPVQVVDARREYLDLARVDETKIDHILEEMANSLPLAIKGEIMSFRVLSDSLRLIQTGKPSFTGSTMMEFWLRELFVDDGFTPIILPGSAASHLSASQTRPAPNVSSNAIRVQMQTIKEVIEVKTEQAGAGELFFGGRARSKRIKRDNIDRAGDRSDAEKQGDEAVERGNEYNIGKGLTTEFDERRRKLAPEDAAWVVGIQVNAKRIGQQYRSFFIFHPRTDPHPPSLGTYIRAGNIPAFWAATFMAKSHRFRVMFDKNASDKIKWCVCFLRQKYCELLSASFTIDVFAHRTCYVTKGELPGLLSPKIPSKFKADKPLPDVKYLIDRLADIKILVAAPETFRNYIAELQQANAMRQYFWLLTEGRECARLASYFVSQKILYAESQQWDKMVRTQRFDAVKLGNYRRIVQTKLTADAIKRCDTAYTLRQLLTILTTIEREIVETEYDSQKEFWARRMANSCAHIALMQRLRQARTAASSMKLLEEVRTYYEPDPKTPVDKSDAQPTGDKSKEKPSPEQATKQESWITCMNCHFRLICPHVDVLITLQAQSAEFGLIQSELTRFLISRIEAGENSDEWTYYCRICGETLFERPADQYAANVGLVGGLDSHLKRIIWKEAMGIFRSTFFANPVDLKGLASTVAYVCHPLVVIFDMKMSKRKAVKMIRKKSDEQVIPGQLPQDVQEIHPRTHVIIILSVYAYLLKLITQGTEIRFDKLNAKPKVEEYIAFVLHQVTQSGHYLFAESEALGEHITMETLQLYFDGLFRLLTEQGAVSKLIYSGSAETILHNIINTDPVYNYAIKINKIAKTLPFVLPLDQPGIEQTFTNIFHMSAENIAKEYRRSLLKAKTGAIIDRTSERIYPRLTPITRADQTILDNLSKMGSRYRHYFLMGDRTLPEDYGLETRPGFLIYDRFAEWFVEQTAQQDGEAQTARRDGEAQTEAAQTGSAQQVGGAQIEIADVVRQKKERVVESRDLEVPTDEYQKYHHEYSLESYNALLNYLQIGSSKEFAEFRVRLDRLIYVDKWFDVQSWIHRFPSITTLGRIESSRFVPVLIRIGQLFDEFGEEHNWGKVVYPKDISLKPKEIAKQILSGKNPVTNLKPIDLACTTCGVRRSQTNKLDETTVLRAFDTLGLFRRFFEFYTSRCPVGDLHNFVADTKAGNTKVTEPTCGQCGAVERILLQTFKPKNRKEAKAYYDKYVPRYHAEQAQYHSANQIKLTAPVVTNVAVIDSSLVETCKQWKFNSGIVVEIAKKVGMVAPLLLNLGLFAGHFIRDIEADQLESDSEPKTVQDNPIISVMQAYQTFISNYNVLRYLGRVVKFTGNAAKWDEQARAQGIDRSQYEQFITWFPPIDNVITFPVRFTIMSSANDPPTLRRYVISEIMLMAKKLWTTEIKGASKLAQTFVLTILTMIVQHEKFFCVKLDADNPLLKNLDKEGVDLGTSGDYIADEIGDVGEDLIKPDNEDDVDPFSLDGFDYDGRNEGFDEW
jgi:hypothetical protein